MGIFDKKSNLEKLAAKKDVKGLIEALDDEDRNVRGKAAEALGKIGDERAIGPLSKTLKDKEWSVQWRAALALGKMGDAKVVEILIQALGDTTVRVEDVVDALVMIGEPAVAPLIQALKDKEFYVRWRAALALGKIGDERAIGPVSQTLEDESNIVRNYAALALGDMGSKNAVGPLIQALKDKDHEVQRCAALALSRLASTLGGIGDEEAVGALIQALNEEDWGVRLEAAVALGKIGDEKAIEPLIQALKDEIQALGNGFRGLRLEAAVALGKIGDERVLELLTQALKDKNKDVREAAKEALREIKVLSKVMKHRPQLDTEKKAFKKIDFMGKEGIQLAGSTALEEIRNIEALQQRQASLLDRLYPIEETLARNFFSKLGVEKPNEYKSGLEVFSSFRSWAISSEDSAVDTRFLTINVSSRSPDALYIRIESPDVPLELVVCKLRKGTFFGYYATFSEFKGKLGL